MYADRISHAMEAAIEETERRREIQKEYNKEHNITSTTISKAIHDILIRKKDEKKRAEEVSLDVLKKSYNILVPKEKKKLLQVMEREMFEYAKNLEFERAAVVRDEIEKVKDMTS